MRPRLRYVITRYSVAHKNSIIGPDRLVSIAVKGLKNAYGSIYGRTSGLTVETTVKLLAVAKRKPIGWFATLEGKDIINT